MTDNLQDRAQGQWLLDLGNSRAKLMWHQGGPLAEQAVMAVPHQGQASTIIEMLQAGLDDQPPPARALMASVAPEGMNETLRKWLETQGIHCHRLRTEASCAGLQCAYEDPSRLGVDRWLAMLGAWVQVRGPLVVADIGTATTLDVVDGQGRHRGGLILPGPGLMRQSLRRGTAINHDPDWDWPEPGKALSPAANTEPAMRDGIVLAQAAAIDRFLADCRQLLGPECRLLVTGGYSGVIMPFTEAQEVPDDRLIFSGMLESGRCFAE